MFKSKDEHREGRLLSTIPHFEMGSKKNKQGSFSILATQTQIKGHMSCEGEVRIAGHFEGSITSKDVLVIEETAYIKGEIHGVIVHIAGTVDGSIYASDILKLSASAKVEGELRAEKLIVSEGAQLRSQVTSLELGKLHDNHLLSISNETPHTTTETVCSH